jgi:SAM-dependent methyltransferase
MGTVTDHYQEPDVLGMVKAGLDRLAPDGRTIELAELTGFDHFHTGGTLATERMAGLLEPSSDQVVLDAGAGLGGPARYLADRFGCRVIGFDLTPTFVEVGQLLSQRTGLSDRVDLRVGDITDLPLEDASIDHAWTQHVAMNIADRPTLYAELRRVLRTGGRLAVFDVIDGGGGELLLPVPWATEADQSHLVTRDAMRELLTGAGFRIELDEDPTEELLAATQQLMQGAPPDHGLTPGVLMANVEVKAPNYLRNLAEGRTAIALMLCTAV